MGKVRRRNEDSYALAEPYGLYVVADGMGGHRGGNVASRLATETMVEFFRASAEPDFDWPYHLDPRLSSAENRLLSAIRQANQRVWLGGHELAGCEGMGSTVVAALWDSRRERLYVGHLGDSRAYRIRGRRISKLTNDHCLAEELRSRGCDFAYSGLFAQNVLTRALGAASDPVVDLSGYNARAGDLYLLCSDGLTSQVADDEILELVRGAPELRLGCKLLVDTANARGGTDNTTVILLRMENASLRP